MSIKVYRGAENLGKKRQNHPKKEKNATIKIKTQNIGHMFWLHKRDLQMCRTGSINFRVAFWKEIRHTEGEGEVFLAKIKAVMQMKAIRVES